MILDSNGDNNNDDIYNGGIIYVDYVSCAYLKIVT